MSQWTYLPAIYHFSSEAPLASNSTIDFKYLYKYIAAFRQDYIAHSLDLNIYRLPFRRNSTFDL